MATKWLTPQRINDLPHLLAGPILRRVDEGSVTVWVALKEHADVTLEVYNSDAAGRTTLMTGKRSTIALGGNLHIVAVTARAPAALSAGNLYFYDLAFDFTNSGHKSLIEAAKTWPNNHFAYAPFALPSFALPPTRIEDLRLISGSCRKPHGEGIDALSLLDDLIRDTVADAKLRPHQLLLTGDQIYADDVAHGLLLLLTDAANALLEWKEELPAPTALRGPQFQTLHDEDWGPQVRSLLFSKAKFTTDDMRCHLMSLGEYVCMYLFAWSDVLWPVVLPKESDFTEWNNWSKSQRRDFSNRFTSETTQLYSFRALLGLTEDRRSIRRALANVPTAMICDDHEVTDDWNMTRRFCQDVYGDPFGFRVVQNALTAYSICQAWGNTPEQFESGPTPPAGLKLLNEIDTIGKSPFAADVATKFTNASAKIAPLVGVHDAATLAAHAAPYRVFHDPGTYVPVNGRNVNDTSIDYHYVLDSHAFKIVVTDSRTWRSFPQPGLDTHPSLIEYSVMSRQLGPQDVGDRVLFVVMTTNFPPIATIGFAAKVPAIGLYTHDLFDSWELPSRPFDQFVAELTKLFTPGPKIQGRVVLLSGDVHFSFASRLGYRAESRLGDPGGAPQAASLVIAQLVGSALHNETDDTRGEETTGYTYTPHWYTDRIRPGHVPVGCAGWNYLGTVSRAVGMGGDSESYVHALVTAEPTYDFTELQDWAWYQAPDFRYRLDYLSTTSSGMHVAIPPTLPPVHGKTGADRDQALSNFHLAAKFALEMPVPGRPDCIGYNNLGDVTFFTSGSDLGVRYKVRSAVGGVDLTSSFSIYEVLLKIDDPNYPFFPERIWVNP